MTENTQQNVVKYAHHDLEVVVNAAKSMGFKVWTYKRMNENEPVSYVYIDNGVTFGGCQNGLGGLRFGTCHKGCQECGSGFGILDFENIEDGIRQCLQYAPDWAMRLATRNEIKKETFATYAKRNTWTTFFEL